MVQLSADRLATNAAAIRRFKPHSLLADDLDEIKQPELLGDPRHLAIVR